MMSAGWRFVNKLKTLKGGIQLLSAAAVTATVSNLDKSRRKHIGKDEVLFISKEDNAIPSTVKILMQEVNENRDPILENGDINWACSCIEKEVVGPCNPEFRKIRHFMHMNDVGDGIEEFDDATRTAFNSVFEDYILCTMDYPVYYADSMLDEEKEELKKHQEKKKEEEERRRKEREANTRLFGKDKVLFLTKEENSKPSTVMVPKVEVEESRSPVLPNGEINWACTCIEKDVVGPCNIEFREFRSFIKENRHLKDDSEMPLKGRDIIANFITCVKANPVYYSLYLSRDDDDDDVDENNIDNDDRNTAEESDS